MNRLKNILIAGALVQVSASTRAVTPTTAPLVIAKIVDMSFGNIMIPSSGGLVVTLPATSNYAATFEVTGQPGFIYAITLPTTATLSDGSHNMSIAKFISSPAQTGTLNNEGNQTLRVGATLTVPVAEPAGFYINTTSVPVTVNYN